MSGITLSGALKEGRLEDFIRQQEESGVDSADEKAFERLIGAAVTPHQSEDQTLHSACDDDLSEK